MCLRQKKQVLLMTLIEVAIPHRGALTLALKGRPSAAADGNSYGLRSFVLVQGGA